MRSMHTGVLVRSIFVEPDASMTLSGFDYVSRTIIHRFDGKHAHVASFCQSYAEGQGEDIAVEQTYAGGDIDIAGDGVIYYTQKTPYEIRRFRRDGTLLTRIHRKNSFMHPPKVERQGESMRLWMPAMSSAIIVDGDHVLNTIILPASETESASTIVDVFDREGHLLATRTFDRIVALKCRDAEGRLHAVEPGEFPSVRRYRAALTDSD